MRFFSKSEKTVSLSTESVLRTLALIFLFFLGLRFLDSVTHQLTLIGVSAFLALALNPAVTWLTTRLKSKSRVRATGVAYLMVIAVLISFIMLIVPPLVRQTSDFVADVPRILNDFQTQDSATARAVRRYNLDEQLDKLGEDFSNRIGDIDSVVFDTATRVGGTLISIITVLVLTFMMLIEGPLWFEGILSLQPADKRAHRRELARKMYRVVTSYVNGQVLIAAIAAAFASIVLLICNTIFDTSVNAVAMAGIVFLFGLIPMFGNILGAALVILVCLLSSGPLALTMLVYFIVYQQIENATLQPYIQSRGNQLTPLLVFIAALLGVGFGGILGALVAIPVAGCLRILFEDYLGQKLPSQQSVEEANT